MRLHEKIKSLRGSLGLNRVEFSKKIDMPLNTLKSIELKGSVPSGDILVAIANKWPEYAAWILLGTNELSDNEKGYFNIVDHVDARFMEQCVVKSDRFSKLIFLQSEESEDLAALFLIDQPALYAISNTPKCVGSVWVKSGNLNFTRNHGGGWSVLRSFRSWLIEENSDLVQKAELYHIDQIVMNDVYKTLRIEKDALKPVVKNERYDNFLRWQEGEGY